MDRCPVKRGVILLLVALPAAALCLCAAPLHCLAAGGPSAPGEGPVWVEAEGEAVLGDVETPKEVMEAAKRQAVARAVEQARGIFVKSHVLVSNGQLAEDLTYASVQGRAASVIPVRQGWDGSDRWVFKVRLKVLVEPVRPPRGAFILKVAMAKADLREGEAARILYQPSMDCYIYIFSVAADGSVTVLLPSSAYPENRAAANEAREFPPAGGPVRLTARRLPGSKGSVVEEKIKVIATLKKQDLIPLGFQEGKDEVYDASRTGMISDLVKKLARLDPSEWTEATAVYVIAR
jgi:hypothetical protein